MNPTIRKTLTIALVAASVTPVAAMAGETPTDSTNATCSNRNTIDTSSQTLLDACKSLGDAVVNETNQNIYNKANKDGQTAYTAESARNIVEAYDAANQLFTQSGITTDKVEDINKAVAKLTDAINSREVASWTVTDGDQTINLSKKTASGNSTQSWSGTLTHKPQGDLQAVGSDGTKVNLTHATPDTAEPDDVYAQYDWTAHYTASPSGTTPGFDVTAKWTDGEPVTASLADNKTGDIKKNANGTYSLGGTVNLGKDNYAPAKITLSDGSYITPEWDAVTYVTADDGTVLVKRTATGTAVVSKDENGKTQDVQIGGLSRDAEGNVTAGKTVILQVKLNLTAQRAWDPTANLTLTYTDKDGKQQSIPVSQFDKTQDGQTVTLDKLPYAEMGDAFTLSSTTGPDAKVTIDRQTVTADGSRSWKVTTEYTDEQGVVQTRHATVTLPFAAPTRNVSNTDARLAGLLVNGQPIAGWDADTLDYTIVAKGSESYKVSPQAADGQTVVASDVTQGAGTTRQEWTVSKDGQSRVYSVTVIRKHDPTAAEQFSPADPTDQDGQTPAPSDSTTDLKSYGYTTTVEKGGKKTTVYTPFTSDDHTIPEGGVFAYESYQNQVVTVKGGRTSGMTWRYTLTVLSPDNHVGVHTVDVTYLTAATHKAALTGIRFDGKNLDGFDPARREYAVQVSDPARYTVMPVFDQSTGMTVSTHKADGKAVVTVTSADGQVKTVYTFDISQAPLPVLSGTQAGTLAQTGTVVGAIGAAALALVAVLAGCVAWLAGRRRKGEGGKDIVA